MNTEKKILKISFNKSGSGGLTPKIALPKKWTDKMKLTLEEREIEVEFRESEEEIIIRKKK